MLTPRRFTATRADTMGRGLDEEISAIRGRYTTTEISQLHVLCKRAMHSSMHRPESYNIYLLYTYVGLKISETVIAAPSGKLSMHTTRPSFEIMYRGKAMFVTTTLC